jgi:hypothetical protein
MPKYIIRNESILQEFLDKFFQSIAKRKSKSFAKKLSNDPEMIQLRKRGDQLYNDLLTHINKKRKEDPEYDAIYKRKASIIDKW